MADPNASQRQKPAATTGNRVIVPSLVAVLGWVVLSTVLFAMSSGGSGVLYWLLRILGFILPILLIALAAGLAGQRDALRREAGRLRRDLEALRTEMRRPLRDDPDSVAAPLRAPVMKPTAQPAPQSTPRPASAATPVADPGTYPVPPQIPVPAATPPANSQESLGLEPARAMELPPLSLADLIRALHFPQTADDTDGFRALRRALRDPRAGEVLRAAQDILTLLSQDGLYMDDLPPDPAGPSLWRRFARDERDPELARLGGIHDERSLEICGARLRDDTVFRDAAHHFLRRFDRMLADVEPQMSDPDLIALTDTRSARAFMLIGRAAGVFDRA